MKARDERVSLMNEVRSHFSLSKTYFWCKITITQVLGAIRMLKVRLNSRRAARILRLCKFMAWERSFEAKILKVREKELKYQKLNYTIEVSNPFSMSSRMHSHAFKTLWNAIW